MELKLTLEQYEALKVLSQCAENFADHVYKVFKRVGLDEIEGCRFSMEVDPQFTTITRQVEFSRLNDSDKCGHFNFTKGVKDHEWRLSDTSSAEFEILFGSEDFRKRISEIANSEHPLPADGLWISTHDDPPYVDGGQ